MFVVMSSLWVCGVPCGIRSWCVPFCRIVPRCLWENSRCPCCNLAVFVGFESRPNMNNCKHSEDETTSAVYLLLGVPPPVQGGQLDSAHASQGPTSLSSILQPTLAEELKASKHNKVVCSKKGYTQKSSSPGIPAVPMLNKADGSSVKCRSLNAVVQQAQECTIAQANVSRKGDVSRLTVHSDVRRQKHKRVRGCEGLCCTSSASFFIVDNFSSFLLGSNVEKLPGLSMGALVL